MTLYEELKHLLPLVQADRESRDAWTQLHLFGRECSKKKVGMHEIEGWIFQLKLMGTDGVFASILEGYLWEERHAGESMAHHKLAASLGLLCLDAGAYLLRVSGAQEREALEEKLEEFPKQLLGAKHLILVWEPLDPDSDLLASCVALIETLSTIGVKTVWVEHTLHPIKIEENPWFKKAKSLKEALREVGIGDGETQKVAPDPKRWALFKRDTK